MSILSEGSPAVGESNCPLVEKMARCGSNEAVTGEAPTPLAWEKHVVRHEIVMAQTLVCVEAIKFVEDKFSSILHSLAVSSKYRHVSSRLSTVMKKSAGELSHSLADENLWLTIPFGVYCYGISQLMTLTCADSEDLSLVNSILLAAKSLMMDVIKQALDDLLDNSERSGVPVDEMTLRHVTDMRQEKNLENTVLQWAEFATTKQDQNRYSHPWLLLPQAQRKIWMRDLEKTLEDDFSVNFRSLSYIAKLALITRELEESAKSLKQKENLKSEYLHLLKASRKEFEKDLLQGNSKKLADDDAMEVGQFHNVFVE